MAANPNALSIANYTAALAASLTARATPTTTVGLGTSTVDATSELGFIKIICDALKAASVDPISVLLDEWGPIGVDGSGGGGEFVRQSRFFGTNAV